MKKVRELFGIVGMVALLGLTSCLDQQPVEDPNKQLYADIATIDAYLKANPPTGMLVLDANGVRMVIEELGTKLPAKSANPAAPTLVNIDYVGRIFPDGPIFDQGNISGSNAKLSGLIDGWKIAFTTLPVGSKAKLYVPSSWAYGKQGQGSIPGNAILTFDVKFKDAVISATEKTKFNSDTTAIRTYLTGKGIQNVVYDTSGIAYVITQQGGGPIASWYNRLTAKFNYKLLTDDTKVVATADQAPSDYYYSRPVDYIHGLKVGLQKIPKGTKATFYIPSGLALGTLGATDSRGVQLIPPDANLIVEVDLTDVTAPRTY